MRQGKQAVAFLKKSSAKDFFNFFDGMFQHPTGSKKVFAELFSKSDRLFAILCS